MPKVARWVVVSEGIGNSPGIETLADIRIIQALSTAMKLFTQKWLWAFFKIHERAQAHVVETSNDINRPPGAAHYRIFGRIFLFIANIGAFEDIQCN